MNMALLRVYGMKMKRKRQQAKFFAKVWATTS